MISLETRLLICYAATMQVLVVQNAPLEGSGMLATLLGNDGYGLRVVQAWREQIPTGDWPLVVVLGGPQSADDEQLAAERRFVDERIRSGRPLLAICLGAQLLAAAAGGRVYRGETPEIGFYHDITIEPQGLFSGIENPMTAFQWHSDTFDLPDQAIRLAGSSRYPNQAFRIGNAVGLQFHLEIDAALVQLWLANGLDQDARRAALDPAVLHADIGRYAPRTAAAMRRFYQNFKDELL